MPNDMQMRDGFRCKSESSLRLPLVLASGARICRELLDGDNTLMATVGETKPSGEGRSFGRAPVASWGQAIAKRGKR